ncbi:hypothetical protein NEIRO03_1665 [Nematocida sp. AWRm78]|nr:hypothetical protein NEIRO02_1723 [Nematocida sp. AWRm79]KAI5184211.1 hypothetical protein NEIRO03_1665 [Nematocida sp. AWRm78]
MSKLLSAINSPNNNDIIGNNTYIFINIFYLNTMRYIRGNDTISNIEEGIATYLASSSGFTLFLLGILGLACLLIFLFLLGILMIVLLALCLAFYNDGWEEVKNGVSHLLCLESDVSDEESKNEANERNLI